MKKILIVTAALLLTIRFANAQTQAGSQNLGLNLSLSTNSASDEAIDPTEHVATFYGNNNNAFSVGPTYSYFIKNNLDLGAGFSYNTSKTTYSGAFEGYPAQENYSNFSAMVYLRKYFLLSNKFGFRFGPYLEYGRQTESYVYPPAETASGANNFNSNTKSMYAGVDLDLVYYPAKHLGAAVNLANINY